MLEHPRGGGTSWSDVNSAAAWTVRVSVAASSSSSSWQPLSATATWNWEPSLWCDRVSDGASPARSTQSMPWASTDLVVVERKRPKASVTRSVTFFDKAEIIEIPMAETKKIPIDEGAELLPVLQTKSRCRSLFRSEGEDGDCRQPLPPVSSDYLALMGPVAMATDVLLTPLAQMSDVWAFLKRPGGFAALIEANRSPFDLLIRKLSLLPPPQVADYKPPEPLEPPPPVMPPPPLLPPPLGPEEHEAFRDTNWRYFQRYSSEGFVSFCRAPIVGGAVEVRLDVRNVEWPMVDL